MKNTGDTAVIYALASARDEGGNLHNIGSLGIPLDQALALYDKHPDQILAVLKLDITVLTAVDVVVDYE